MNIQFKIFALIIFLTCFTTLNAQTSPNDDCENASEIAITNKGYDFGTFISTKANITNATLQKAEKCVKELEETGNCSKTVWYKFYIPTTRDVSVKLTQQDSAIPQIFSGFNIYKVPDCNYNLSAIASQLTPLNKFGTSGNTCLDGGWYLVQVGCKQKAKGEIWIELSSLAPSGNYDNHTDYFDFKVVKNQEKSERFYFDCTGLEPEEFNQLKDGSLKSIWVKYTFAPNAVYNSVFIKKPSGALYKAYYRVFKNNINSDSLKNKKPYLFLPFDNFILQQNCHVSDSQTFFLQIVVEAKEYTNVEMVVSNFTYKADDWNTPNTTNVADISYSKSYSQTHYYNCDGYLKNHKCKNVIPDYYLNKYKKNDGNKVVDAIDTLKIAGYTIINVLEDGRVRLYRGSYCLYSVYEGDIRNSCSLNPVKLIYTNSSYYYFCAKKGVYTMITAVQKLGPSNEQSIKLEKLTNKNIKYNNPKFPEKLKAININNPAFSSDTVGYSAKDTTFILDTIVLKGRMNFREFSISETCDLDIGGKNGFCYIFKGSISKGNIKPLKGINYKSQTPYFGFYLSGGFFGSSKVETCFILEKGDYTIISIAELLDNDCVFYNNFVGFQMGKICPPGNNIHPQFASPINGNKDVLSSTPNLVGLNYTYNLAYCDDCGSKITYYPKLSCFNKKLIDTNTFYSYYTFYLGDNCEMNIENNFELYEGNVITKPFLLNDTINIISPCTTGNTICNLKGGKYYTLVIIHRSRFYNTAQVYFTKHVLSANDFAAHAFDFGNLVPSTPVKSTFETISCHTNACITDPIPPRFYSKSDSGTNYAIPYKDLQNLRRIGGRKNLWYTFTASGTSTIKIKVLGKQKFNEMPEIFVYRYKGNYNTDFKSVLANNFDSTYSGMEYIANNERYNQDSISFTNSLCNANRYFILLEGYSGTEYSVQVQMQNIALLNVGDLCSNAVTGSYNKFGKYFITTNTTCHSYGNSVFEESPDETIKSTWFKIKVTDLEKFDLQIRNLVMSYGIIRYNVYGGNCKSMTRITNLTDRYSYFTLSCMGIGEYYIQAISNKENDGIVQFEVNILKPENSACKPYDFKYPIAQFKLTGGCQYNDSIKFINLSTRGEDISYQWYLNGKLFSALFSPLLFRQNPALLDTNEIKLIVNNTAEFTRDTFITRYIKDTRIYNFKINGPKISHCKDTMKLEVKTDYPYKINYLWYYYNEDYPESQANPFIKPNSQNITYFVKGESDNCVFRDTFQVKLIPSLNLYHDTSVCEYNPFILKRKSYFYLNGTRAEANDSFIINKTGNYAISYTDSLGCWYRDNIKVAVEYGPKLLKKFDSLYYCNISLVDLSYKYEKLLHYQWNTGDSSPSIRVNKNGNYYLKGPFSECRSLDYTVNLEMETINTDRLKDTFVCQKINLSMVNPYPSKFKVLVKEPLQSTVKTNDYFKRKLILQKSQCVINDSSYVFVYPFEGHTTDSMFCDSTGNFNMTLDAGNAQKYHWYKNDKNSRLLNINDYGVYPVSRKDLNGCLDTINFNINNSCPFKVYVPNVFSPNGDFVNDLFMPSVSGMFKYYQMTIFNRWGELIFESKNNEPWNGNYLNTSVSQGVYWYTMVVYDINNIAHRQTGCVMVLR